jgi:hypothetical protein
MVKWTSLCEASPRLYPWGEIDTND